MSQPSLVQRVNAVLAELSADIKNNKLHIPSPPDLLSKIRRLTESEDVTSQDIANLVQFDPNTSGRIIKVANCALFGSRYHVSSISSAVSRLGLSRVRNLLIGLSIAQNFINSKTKGLEKLVNQTWKHSNLVAAISFCLAQKKTNIPPEEALLAGMIHNIGVLPLALRLNEVEGLRDNAQLREHIAQIVIPKLYPHAGKLIMDTWHFPAELSHIALTHQDLTLPSKGPISLSDIVQVAYQLALLKDIDDDDTASDIFCGSDAFKKFWNDWTEASADLSEMKQQFDQINYDMTH